MYVQEIIIDGFKVCFPIQDRRGPSRPAALDVRTLVRTGTSRRVHRLASVCLRHLCGYKSSSRRGETLLCLSPAVVCEAHGCGGLRPYVQCNHGPQRLWQVQHPGLYLLCPRYLAPRAGNTPFLCLHFFPQLPSTCLEATIAAQRLVLSSHHAPRCAPAPCRSLCTNRARQV